MEFKSVKDIEDYLLQYHNLKLVKKSEYYDNRGKSIGFLFSKDGKKYLNERGYFDRYDIRKKIGPLYNNFKCDNCRLFNYESENESCKKCRTLEKLIKNM